MQQLRSLIVVGESPAPSAGSSDATFPTTCSSGRRLRLWLELAGARPGLLLNARTSSGREDNATSAIVRLYSEDCVVLAVGRVAQDFVRRHAPKGAALAYVPHPSLRNRTLNGRSDHDMAELLRKELSRAGLFSTLPGPVGDALRPGAGVRVPDSQVSEQV